jgi:hypothetical protein
LWKSSARQSVVHNFAHQTFKWKNEAKGNAAVHCVIIGFALFDKDQKYLYTYADIAGEPLEQKVTTINPYLIEAPEVIIDSRSKPICIVPDMVWGNKPVDGGHLILSDKEKQELLEAEPNAEKYIKRLVGAKEFIQGNSRWCLWLVGAEPSELKTLPYILRRIEQVRQTRLASIDEGARKLADRPTEFRDTQNPESFMVIPSVSSERREYIPMGLLTEATIATNLVHTIPNATLYHFGILTSKMHMTWVRYTCGRLESRYRYSKDIVYNNFPWPGCAASKVSRAEGGESDGVTVGERSSPTVSDNAKEKIEECAQAVLDARAQFPNSSLADLYDPRTMPPTLRKAHDALDRAVDAAYNYKPTQQNPNPHRIAFLFDLYQKIINL